MKIFVASSLCWDYLPTEVIQIAKVKGLTGVEMWAEHIYFHGQSTSEIRQTAANLGILLTVHAPSWDLNMCSMNEAIQQQTVSELKKSIDLAKELDALHMTFHPGRLTVKDYLKEEHWNTMVHRLQELVNYANSNNVVLSLELMEEIPKEIITTPEQMNQLLSEVGEDLHVTLDIAHTPLDESNLDYFNKLNRVNSFHLSDSSRTTYHLPLGEGEIPVQDVLKGLASTEIPFVLEGMETNRTLNILKKHLNFLRENDWLEKEISSIENIDYE